MGVCRESGNSPPVVEVVCSRGAVRAENLLGLGDLARRLDAGGSESRLTDKQIVLGLASEVMPASPCPVDPATA
jgi:hypothetical protein